jgi:iron only hydrogenase large subunit-like protein
MPMPCYQDCIQAKQLVFPLIGAVYCCFCCRYKQAKSVAWEPPESSRAVSSTRTSVEAPNQAPYEIENPAPAHDALPMLVSACPGWVCYAEKTTPAAIPYMSTTKSPQQVGHAPRKPLALEWRLDESSPVVRRLWAQ